MEKAVCCGVTEKDERGAICVVLGNGGCHPGGGNYGRELGGGGQTVLGTNFDAFHGTIG